MQVLEHEIDEITRSIWASLLDLTLEKRDTSASDASNPRTFTGCVQITGAWEGAVLLHCPSPLAREATAIMFEMDIDAASDDEVKDALGELTNMIGGNVKALLPEPCRLSLPSVTEGLDYSVTVPGSRAVTEVTFDCGGQTLSVTLLVRDFNEELSD